MRPKPLLANPNGNLLTPGKRLVGFIVQTEFTLWLRYLSSEYLVLLSSLEKSPQGQWSMGMEMQFQPTL